MGSTNKTTNYELSQFIGTDKPSWLNDYDNDMLKIDTAMKNNATAAAGAQSTANTADGKADANAIAIGTLDTQINTPSTGLAAVVSGNTSAIGTINGAIGNTALPTTAQTLTGAIAELDSEKIDATALSGLISYTGISNVSVTTDGVKTYSAIFDELNALFAAHLADKNNKYLFMPESLIMPAFGTWFPTTRPFMFNKSWGTSAMHFTGIQIGANTNIYFINMSTSASVFYSSVDGTITDLSNTVPASGVTITFEFTEFMRK